MFVVDTVSKLGLVGCKDGEKEKVKGKVIDD